LPPIPPRPLLFLDYDGTLAPIVDDPASAYPHPDVPALLRRLAQRHPVWVVTGRDLATLGRLLPVDVPALGLHGAEEGVPGGPSRRAALETHAPALERLKASVPDLPGVRVEDKGAAFAVHYRHAEDESAVLPELERWAAEAPADLEPIWGKKVVELRARGVNKGTAVARLSAEHPERTPVYLGDDVTDEDAFRALGELRQDAVTIKVGPGETAARYRLADVEETVAYLTLLADREP
jgi:trehalose 6-phosphate phosphatase